jgi:hypothetical protein
VGLRSLGTVALPIYTCLSTGRERSNENLKRGQQKFKGTERGEALARQDRILAENAEDPAVAIRRMFIAAAQASLHSWQKLNRSGVHDPQLIPVSRECRQLAERVLEHDLMSGQNAEVEHILRLMDAALYEAEEQLASGWTPPQSPPDRSDDR